MKRRIMGGVLLLVLACALAVAYRSDRLLFEIPAEDASHYSEKVGYSLAKHHGLAFLMTFDEARPVEWIGRGAVQYPGTESVPGRIGQARRFDGSQHAYIETSAFWPNLGSNYTLSLWVNLESTGTDQEIWYTTFQEQLAGFKLRHGQLTFFVPGGQAEQAAAYPFDAFGRFVHLVGVVDGSGGEARLYENGILKATIPVESVLHPNHNMEFGKTRWYGVTAPFRGTLDEAAAWNRTLSEKEIRALAHAHCSLPCTLEPFAYGQWRIAQVVQTAIPDTLRLLDRFNPLLQKSRVSAADLPEVYLQFSSSDARHFIRAHNRSLASGRRTASGANPRRIDAQYDGYTVEAQAWLDGSDTRYPQSRRPGYILETPADAPAFGARWLRLVPPENVEAGLPGIGAALANITHSPNPTQGLCRLTINGHFKGIYYFENFDQRGLKPGERSWVANGPKNPSDWRWLFRATPPDPTPPDAILPPENRDAQIDHARQLLVNDIFNPWSSREWAWRIRKCQAAPPPPQAEILSPYAVLGSNPSPYYIVGDLDLRALRGKPLDIVWHSSRPDLIDEYGKVTRPTGDSPVGVELTPALRGGDHAEAAPLRFRVMPENRKLPALMLYIDEPLSNCRRVDFLARFYPAHGEGRPRLLQGGQATRGGIKHRGNSSYWRGQKKPLSLRFDEPHHLMGQTGTRHLYLLNGYLDIPKLRNKFAFDLFRSFGSEGRPRYAPEVDWTEVFVNGVYFGVYEMCTRVDEYMVGFDQDPAAPATAGVLYMINAPESLFAEAQTEKFAQVFPSSGPDGHGEPLQELMVFTSQADTGKFAREIEDWIDLDNAIDFILLLNFVQNMDGRTTNFYLARAAAPGSRFFFIPWDYDHTFAERNPWLSNHLFDRLRNEYPDFEGRLSRRWRELRHGPLSDAALDARLLEMAGHLTGYMEWEYELLQYPGQPSFLDRVEELRQVVQTNLRNMDARLLPATPANEHVP